MRVLLFGRLAELAGWREREVEAADSLSQLRAHLAAEDPLLAEALDAHGVQAAVDQSLWRQDALPAETQEIAFLPPMSGG